MDFVVVDRDEDNAVLAKQVACQKEAWIHHVQPVTVLMPAGIGAQAIVASDIPFVVGDAGFCFITFARLLEIIVVDKIVASVIRRVNVGHLHLAIIALVQNLQCRQVVALDEHIARSIPINGMSSVNMERLDCLLLDFGENVALALPTETVALTQIDRLAKRRLEQHPVNFILSKHLRKKLAELR